jgi:hypothetical protein
MGQRPVVLVDEVVPVVAYIVGLSVIASFADVSLDARMVEPDLRIGARVQGGTVRVTVGSAPPEAAVVEGSVLDLVDRATGRWAGPVTGDARGLAVLDGLAAVLSPS